MKLTVGGVLADAWALWRRDRNLLVRIGAPFLFLPSLATQLLVPQPPITAADASLTMAEALRRATDFWADHAAAYVIAGLVAQLGVATLTAFYCDRQVGEVSGALRRGALLWPRFVVAAFIVQLLTVGGLFVFVVGALAVMGRTLLTGPMLVAGRPISAAGAVARSVSATAGATLPLAALAVIAPAGGLVAAEPFVAFDGWLKSLHAPNPVAVAAIDSAVAGVAMLAAIAAVLIAVSAYRALASGARSGI